LKETDNFKFGPDYIHWRLNTPILTFTHGFLILTNSRWAKDSDKLTVNQLVN